VLQSYESEVGNEYVIRGNSALLKCGIPSYVADLVQVGAWLDDHGQTYHPTDSSSGKTSRFTEAIIPHHLYLPTPDSLLIILYRRGKLKF
jgi:hypothetical protein